MVGKNLSSQLDISLSRYAMLSIHSVPAFKIQLNDKIIKDVIWNQASGLMVTSQTKIGIIAALHCAVVYLFPGIFWNDSMLQVHM